MFSALRSIRSKRKPEDAPERRASSVHATNDRVACAQAALAATRALREARRGAFLDIVPHHSGGSDHEKSHHHAARVRTVACRSLDSRTAASVRHLASLSYSAERCQEGAMLVRVCAWTQIAASAILHSCLTETLPTLTRTSSGGDRAPCAQSWAHVRNALRVVAARHCATRPSHLCGLHAERSPPEASGLFARTAPVLHVLLTAAAGDSAGCRPQHARHRAARRHLDLVKARTSKSRLPVTKRARSTGSCSSERAQGVDPANLVPGVSTSPALPAAPSSDVGTTSTGGTRAFAFRVRVGDVSGSATACHRQATPPPPQHPQKAPPHLHAESISPSAGQSTAVVAATAAGPPRADAVRGLLQTRLTAFAGARRDSTAVDSNNSHSRRVQPSAAAVAVLGEIRGHTALPVPPYGAATTGAAGPLSYGCPASAKENTTTTTTTAADKGMSWYDSHVSVANTPHLPTHSSHLAPRKAPPYNAGVGAEAGSVSGGGHQGRAQSTTSALAGFVTAGEQLDSDIRSGRANPASAALLSRRSPALGLRRTGFQPPFQPQQQPQQQQPSADVTDTVLSVNKVLKAVAAPKQANHAGGGDDDDDAGSYPASLLLPDGSVPAILQPLDPKLVTQVAMEILEDGAGAKKIGWDDIAGLQHAKGSVEEAIVWPLRRPDLFVGLRDPPRGLLLFGPPGTGKTMIARAIANRTECTFLNISSSSLMSKWVGDGEKLVRCLFAVATVKQPSVIFIDEIDSLLSMRGEGEMDAVRRVKTEFLVQLDGVATDRGDRVLLIGATNRPDELDEAARRRMEKRLYIPLPDQAARKQLIHRLLFTLEQGVNADTAAAGKAKRSSDGASSSGDDKEDHEEAEEKAGGHHSTETCTTRRRASRCAKEVKSPTREHTSPPPMRAVHILRDSDLDYLASVTQGYSGADLKQLCREASMGPLREMSMHQLSEVAVGDLRPIDRRDFRHALKRLKPSVGVDEVVRYEEWNKQYGSFADNSDGDEDMTDSDASPTK